MPLSGIGQPYDRGSGQGVVGRNYAYQTISMAKPFFERQHLNPFIGADALVQGLDDFNGDNFDHSKLDFIGGASIVAHQTNGRPIASCSNVPPGTPRWGSAWKQAFANTIKTTIIYTSRGTVTRIGTCFGPRTDLQGSVRPPAGARDPYRSERRGDTGISDRRRHAGVQLEANRRSDCGGEHLCPQRLGQRRVRGFCFRCARRSECVEGQNGVEQSSGLTWALSGVDAITHAAGGSAIGSSRPRMRT
jgi:hypothetical protein